MTKSVYCHGCSMICDDFWHNIIVFGLHIGLHIQHCQSVMKSTVCHGCSVIYDEIWKRQVNFVIDQRISCSGRWILPEPSDMDEEELECEYTQPLNINHNMLFNYVILNHYM
jgi:hypothetical protein